MKVKFNRITKELTFLEGTTTLNSNDVLWHKLEVEMEGGDLLTNESLWVTFDNGNGISTQGDMTPRLDAYPIPKEVLSVPGEWTLQLLIKVYDAVDGEFIERGGSNPATFTVQAGLHFNGDDNPITNNTAGSLRTDLNEASESLELLWSSHRVLESTTNGKIENLKEVMPYVADFNFPYLSATYEELKNNPVLNFEGIVRKPVKVGSHFGTLAMTTDDRTVWVSLSVTEVREEDGYLLKAKVNHFYDYVDGKLVNDVKLLKSEIPLVVNTKEYINKPFQEIVDTFNGGIPLEWYPLMRIHEAYFNKPPMVGDTFWLIVESEDAYIFQLRASIEEVYAEGDEYYGYVRWNPHTGSILLDVALDTFFVLRDPTIKNGIPLIEYEVRHAPRTYQWYLDALNGWYSIATGDLLLNRQCKPGDIFTRIVKTEDGYICLVKLEVSDNYVQANIKDVVVLYSPEELNAIKSRLDSFSLYEIVSSLPASGDANKLYLKPSSGQEEGNILEEWLWVNNKWEMVGTKKVEIDLTPYAKKDEVISLSQKGVANGVASLDANGKVPEEQLPENIGNNNNLENGKGKGAFQQIADGVAEGFDYAEYNADGSVKSYKNPTAMEWISEELKAHIDGGGKIPYGAEGNFSSAIGGKSYAYGKRSHAEGTTTIAFGDYSHVEGNNSVTLGANSHAEGKQTTTLGENSHAEGFDTFAKGYISHAEGYQTHAEGSVSHAEGQGTHAEGDQSHAEGNGTHAQGHYSHAEGYGTHAKGKASHASGEGTIAEGDYQTVVGTYNPPVDMVDLNENTKAKVLFIVGNGKNDAERGIAFAVLDNGEAVSGYGDKPSSDISLINVAQFYDLLSQETTSNLIDGRLPFSVQPKPNIGEGNPNSIADYEYDFVFGKGLRTTNEYETVFGRYNTYSDADWQHPKALFVIGNGTSNSNRSNAFEVKEDGTAYAGGKKVLCEGEVSGGTKLYRHTIKSSSTADKLIVETYKSTPLVHTETMPDGNDYYLLDYDISKYALNMYVVSNNTFKKVVDFKHTDYDTYVYFYVASGYTFLQEEHIGIIFSKAQIPNENYKIEEI